MLTLWLDKNRALMGVIHGTLQRRMCAIMCAARCVVGSEAI